MGRRLLLLAVGLVGVTVYLVYRDRGDAIEEDTGPVKELQVKPAAQLAVPLTGAELVRQELAAGLALGPGQGFPAAVPWYPLHQIGGRGGYPLENLLHARPVRFLEMCLERYEREVQGYSLTFRKKERIAGKLHPPEKDKYEVTHCLFREEPFSVQMTWVEGARLAQKVVYVKGENADKVLVRPRGLLGVLVVARDVDGDEAKASGRYTIDQFGLYLAMQRTVNAMRRAEARGALHVHYEGQVRLEEVGDRVCHKFVRTPYDPPEDEGVNELTLYVDAETWLQVGSVLRDPQGNLVGEYFFRNIVINPTFPEKAFTRAAL